VPAAAVIPAPRAYINVVAVKKPVVGFENKACGCSEAASVVTGSQSHMGLVLRHAGLSTG